MYRTLIVEDNAIFRYAIRTIINWEQHGFVLAGEAVNGRQALERLECEAVDLLITDMSMPEMNGIELIQALKEHSPSTKVIVLSSYDDFQFVKEALKLGALDYLLKHDLEEEALLKALSTAREHIIRDQQSAGLTAATGREHLKRMLQQVLTGQLVPTDLDMSVDDCHQSFMRSPIAVLSFRLAYESEGSQAAIAMVEALKLKLELNHVILSPAPGRTACIVSFGKERSETRLAALAHQAATWVAAELRHHNLAPTVGLSAVRCGIKELPSLYTEAEGSLFRCIYMPEARNSVYNPDHGQANPMDVSQLTELLQEVCVSLRAGSKEGFLEVAGLFLARLKNQQPEEAVFKRLWLDLFAFLVVAAAEKQIRIRNMDYWHHILNESVTKLVSVDELYQTFVNQCMDVLDTKCSLGERREIQMAMDYIEAHLHEEFTVMDIATLLNLSPNYLSNLFRQQTGKRLVEYAQERRIEAAKKLLTEHPLKVYEIAEKVGFRDASYFCKVFKDVTGMTVSDYKKGQLRKATF